MHIGHWTEGVRNCRIEYNRRGVKNSRSSRATCRTSAGDRGSVAVLLRLESLIYIAVTMLFTVP